MSTAVGSASNAQRQPQSAVAQPFEVLMAVQTLYEDELRPVGRILRKRITEIIASRNFGYNLAMVSPTDDSIPDLDSDRLRHLCEAIDGLKVTQEKGGDWCATITGWSPRFVDIYSRYDSYAAELWLAFAAYCEGPEAHTMTLPGGRYTCARALMARGLHFLAGFSLGRVCHIVQLALTEKKILGYFSQSVVPYARSQSMRKEQCAKTQQPCSKGAPMTLASWDVARACLREIIVSSGGEVPLSNVKRLFRSRFHLELSETSFGYSKVSELLQDANFRDICAVHLRGRGYIVTRPPLGTASLPSAVVMDCSGVSDQRSSHQLPVLLGNVTIAENQRCREISLVEQIPVLGSNTFHSTMTQAKQVGSMSVGASFPIACAPVDDTNTTLPVETCGQEIWRRRPGFCSEEGLILSLGRPGSQPGSELSSPLYQSRKPMLSWSRRASRCVVQNTFLELPETPNTQVVGSIRRMCSAPPKVFDSVSGCLDMEEASEELMSRSPKRYESRRSYNASTAVNTPVGDQDLSPSSTSSASWTCSPSWEEPKRVLSPRQLATCSGDQVLTTELDPDSTEPQEMNGARQRQFAPPALSIPGKDRRQYRIHFCDSPDTIEKPLHDLQIQTPMTPPMRTPGVLVQNTFLHIVVPSTPAGSTARASSVPRNM